MPVSQEYLQLWQSQTRDRLQDELAQCMRAERCHLEFYMVCDKQGRIGPCTVLTCWDDNNCQTESGRERTRRKVQKKIHKLHSMQGCRFPCKVVIDKMSLLARSSKSDIKLVSSIKARFEESHTTLVSLLLNSGGSDIQECTLGGLIRVDTRLYGLTVAHPFSSA